MVPAEVDPGRPALLGRSKVRAAVMCQPAASDRDKAMAGHPERSSACGERDGPAVAGAATGYQQSARESVATLWVWYSVVQRGILES